MDPIIIVPPDCSQPDSCLGCHLPSQIGCVVSVEPAVPKSDATDHASALPLVAAMVLVVAGKAVREWLRR